MRHIANVTLASLAYMAEVSSLTSFLFLSLTVLSLSQFFFFFPKSDFLSLFLFTSSSNILSLNFLCLWLSKSYTLSLSTLYAFGCLNLADDGSVSFLISLFRCGDLAVVGLYLGLADMGINNFDVCLVVDVSFLISLFRRGDLAVVGLDLGLRTWVSTILMFAWWLMAILWWI